MKKAYFLPVLLLLLLALAACGKETEEEPRYYEIRVESGQLEELESGQFLLGQQYYRGEPVSLIAEAPAAEGAENAMDVYIRPMGGEKELLLSGVSRQYRVRGWYLDEKGRCFVKGSSGLTRLDGDGNPLYYSPLSDLVTDMCCTEGGRVILQVQKAGRDRYLAELDPDTGSITPIENASLNTFSYTCIGSLGNDLLLLNGNGVWQINLKKDTKDLILPFTGTLYSLEITKTIADFWSDGIGAGILFSSGESERLEWVDVTTGKEIITVRTAYPDLLRKSLSLFNQSSDAYYAVLDEPGLNYTDFLTWSDSLTDFMTETNLKLAAGKGADVICFDALHDGYSLIEKGVFADLAPMMEASGIREEDYFRTAFDAWRDGDKIYGVMPYMRANGMSLDKAVLNGREDPDIEGFVDSLLEFEEDRCLSKDWDGADILDYFLEGSGDLWGMVDWEKGTCDFSGDLFSKMLLAAKRYGAEEMRRQYPEITGSRESMRIYYFDTEKKLAADGQAAFGFFFDDGNYPLSPVLIGNNYIIGINAESEHADGAWQLIAFLLGEEAQSTIDIYFNYIFPTNKRVFDRLAKAEMDYGTTIQTEHKGEIYTHFFPGRNLGNGQGLVVLEEQTVAELRQMLSDARVFPYRIKPLLAIISEETAYYFDDAKSMEEVIALVQNRVQLYLDEH